MALDPRSRTVPNVIALTCTGARHKAFRLCRAYVARQTLKPKGWIVVDDCIPRTYVPSECFVVYPEPPWHPGMEHTLPRNMLAGLKTIRERATNCDVVTIFEDDDWYSPVYVARMAGELQRRYKDGVRLIGEMNTVFYNVRTRTWRQNWHPCHASLCSVSFHFDILDEIIAILEYHDKPTVDHAIFKAIAPERTHLLPSNTVLGIKGIPDERVGESRLHQEIKGRFVHDDYNFSSLRAFIGDDANAYEEYFVSSPKPERCLDEKPTPVATDEKFMSAPAPTMTKSQKRYAKLRQGLKRST